MNKKLINFIKTEENLTLETKITLFNPHVVQTDLIERNASRESIQIIRTENYTITRCIIKTRPRNIFLPAELFLDLKSLDGCKDFARTAHLYECVILDGRKFGPRRE